MSIKRYYPIAGFLGFIILFQLISTLAGREFYLTQLTMSAYYVIVVLGLCTLMGYAGQISLGHAAFFAIGGYTTSVLTTLNLKKYAGSGFVDLIMSIGFTSVSVDPYGEKILHVSPWISLFIAVFITFIISFLIGIPILKLKGHYLAMATLGFGIIIYRTLLGSSIFGEADGISDVPGFNLLPGLQIKGASDVRVMNYYIAWFFVLVCLLLLINLINSRVGRALRSIHGSEEAANSMGVNPAKYKLGIFVFSAILASVAGVFMAHYNGGIGPSESGVIKSVRYVAIVAVGGMANIWGALIMGSVLNFLSLRGLFGSYDDAVFGIILIVVMIFAPDGVFKLDNIRLIKEKLKGLG
jgi:branched-chain amino acid transport system permease protein